MSCGANCYERLHEPVDRIRLRHDCRLEARVTHCLRCDRADRGDRDGAQGRCVAAEHLDQVAHGRRAGERRDVDLAVVQAPEAFGVGISLIVSTRWLGIWRESAGVAMLLAVTASYFSVGSAGGGVGSVGGGVAARVATGSSVT